MDLTFDDYLSYARSTPTFTNPDAWAVKHHPLRDADPLVAEWKRRRELVLEGRAPAEVRLTPFHVAAQAVSSVAQVPGCDVGAYIDGLRDVDEPTRAKLRERFLAAQRAEAGAGRAPP